MPQQLIIQNFGPITDLKIEIQDILIFIGSQASGKSTVSKAIFFFKSLRDDLTTYLYQCYNEKQFEDSVSNFAKRAKQKFIKMYGSVLQFPEMELNYQYGNGMVVTVKPSTNKQFTTVDFDDFFKQKFRDLVDQSRNLNAELQQMSSRVSFSSSREISAIKAKEATLFENITQEVNQLFNDDRDLLFLPAGRSLITILSQQRYNIDMGDDLTSSNTDLASDSLIKLDYLMQNFINRIDSAKPIFNQAIADLIKEKLATSTDNQTQESIVLAQSIVDAILKGSYRYQNGTERIDFGNGKSTLINFASSGQQEVVWILLLILLLILNQRKVFLVIEEPEAHLFPVAQKQMIDLIALLANQSANQIILTTHSPYILSSFNNLLYAHQLGLQKSKQVEEIVNHNLWIDPHRLNAFIVEQGTNRSIMDSEMGLIESAEIDRASEIIVNTFNQLFEIED
ncbi:AAA family ATPase [Sphaerospermopsis aphanizomenoides BCCUSP55]|uniref:AAA family ATPase n=1 Tax=Sphaerospermopsis aphanizomenoides TaxID=459663 RepID=UPI001908CCFE|nr:AAA family ATPase [Sphaerospermopsis aphanizomenoides]MBK1988541.1 AAA family ATPase [Sphaerospermopsis aphanizomenoides BCCUSP55]